jgi:hypothetical protein
MATSVANRRIVVMVMVDDDDGIMLSFIVLFYMCHKLNGKNTILHDDG